MISIIINNYKVLIIILIGKWEIVHTTTIAINDKEEKYHWNHFQYDFFPAHKNKKIKTFESQSLNAIISSKLIINITLLCVDGPNKIKVIVH